MLKNWSTTLSFRHTQNRSDMDFEPELDLDLFDEDLLDEIDKEFDLAEDYDDHYADEEDLEEEDI